MVIQLDYDYETVISARGLSSDELPVFEHLLEHMRDRRIFLLASRGFYGYLLRDYGNVFSKSIISMLQNVLSKATTLLTEAKGVPPFMILVADGAKKGKVNGTRFVTIADLPLDYDCDPWLCCENVEDSEFYRNLYSQVNPRKGTGTTRIKLNSFGGTDKKMVLRWFSERKICLVICDSDVKYPGCAFGSTATAFRKLFMKETPLYGELIVLSVHEKENLFPWDLLPKNQDENVQTVIEELVRLKKGNPDIQDYFDIKDGISIADADSPNMPEKWEKLYRPIIKFIQANGIEHSKSQPTTKQLFAGIKNGGLSKALSSNIDPKTFWALLTQRQRTDLQTIFDAIYRFGYAYSDITS